MATEISPSIGTQWTNQHGEVNPLTVDDFMVVAPYNDQVNVTRSQLNRDERTRGVEGRDSRTNSKGRQAAVVFFEHGDFHWRRHASRCGLPVLAQPTQRGHQSRAVSRLSVCTGELLNTRARNIAEMRLISTLCALTIELFAEAGRSGTSRRWRPVR